MVAHELGHFLAAKACGMRVDEFAVGFGNPRLTITRRGGTEYNLRPIPAGGFVRIPGMDPSEEGPSDGFNAQSVWKRMIVIFAGPFASFLFAYIVFIILGMTAGLPVGQPLVASLEKGSPAARAGMKPHDKILEVAGVRIKDADQLVETIQSHPAQTIPVVVQRGAKRLVLQATPRADKQGTKTIGRLGFVTGSAVKKLGVVQAVKLGTEISFGFVRKLVQTIFSKAIAREAGGPIAIVQATSSAAQDGIVPLVVLAAGLSLNFAVLNLLPIGPLDGSLLLLLFIEAIRGRRLSPRTQQAALTVGFAVLGVIIVLVMYKDISNLPLIKSLTHSR